MTALASSAEVGVFLNQFAETLEGDFAIDVTLSEADGNGNTANHASTGSSETVVVKPLIHMGSASPLAEEVPALRDLSAEDLGLEWMALNAIVDSARRNITRASGRTSEDVVNERIKAHALQIANEANRNERSYEELNEPSFLNKATNGFLGAAVIFANMSRAQGHEQAVRQLLRSAELFAKTERFAASAIVLEIAAAMNANGTRWNSFRAEKAWLQFIAGKPRPDRQSRYIAVNRGLRHCLLHCSWAQTTRLLDILADLDFEADDFDSSVRNKLRTAWAKMKDPSLRKEDLAFVAQRIEQAWQLLDMVDEADARIPVIKGLEERVRSFANNGANH